MTDEKANESDVARGRSEPSRTASNASTSGAWLKRFAETLLRWLNRGKRHRGLARLYTSLPFAWRLALRRRVHAVAGKPMSPLPIPAFGRPRRVRHAEGSLSSPGTNLLGYARGEFGIAENVRSYARALESADYPFLIFNFDVGSASRQEDHSMDGRFSDILRHRTNVFFVNADQLTIARRVLGRNAFANHYNIGFWVWELEKFPRDWRSAFALVDEVWVPTDFVRKAVTAATDKPVLRMPKAIEFQVPVGMDRGHFGLSPDEYLFLFSYDFNSFVSRKNPEATIAAFRHAFASDVKGVRLLVKSTNGERFPDQLAALRRDIADDPRIELRDGFLSRTEMFGLQNVADCFVSLHRSEGFGLGMAECMYLGKPVIATGYSGNLDFMDRDNSLLVDYRMVPLRDGDYMYWEGQRWADPNVAHAARLMRQVFDDRPFARRIGAAAADAMRRSHLRAMCGAALVHRLREIDGHKALEQ